jgi:hypothetical protein
MKYYKITDGAITNGRFTGTGSMIIEEWGASPLVKSYSGTFVADQLQAGSRTEATQTDLSMYTVSDSGSVSVKVFDFSLDPNRDSILQDFSEFQIDTPGQVVLNGPAPGFFGLWNYVSSTERQLANGAVACHLRTEVVKKNVFSKRYYTKFSIVLD